VSLKWAVTSANPAAQCRSEPTLHALFFQVAKVQCPTRASILFTRDRFTLQVFSSRENMVDQEIRICGIIGCRLPGTEEIVHAGSVSCHGIIES